MNNKTSALAQEEIERLMKWIQEDMVNPFDDEEIMGDHRVIVDLYHYCRSLESRLAVLQREKEETRKAIANFPHHLRANLSGHKGEAFRVATQLAESILSRPAQ